MVYRPIKPTEYERKEHTMTMTIATSKIKEITDSYKANFAAIDIDERYKWVAVKHFRDNWNIETPNFADMLEYSFAKNGNLLDTGVARPLALMVFFAKREPETVRSLFRALFDESQPADTRISNYIDSVKFFVDKMKQEGSQWKNTFQDQRAISVYLTFKYPENYYLYKYSTLKTVAPILGIEQNPDRLMTYTQMCDAIRELIIRDEELISMSRARLGDDCYQDPNNRMLATDIAYYAYRLQIEKEEAQKLAAKPAVVRDFKKWLEAPTRKAGKPYDYKTVKVYLAQVEKEAEKLVPPYDGHTNLFTYDTVTSCIPQIDRITEIISKEQGTVNGAYPKVLQLYRDFLEERETSTQNAGAPASAITASGMEYSREKFLEEVFLTAEDYDSLINQLIRKKNIILQGAPGVGKTFAAIRLAYSLIREKNSKRICFVQFHQSYGYEDFVMGYRPCDSGFRLEEGAFYTFCNNAGDDPDNDWFFIIDEINRGNISKIFGELLMLIEADKRGKEYAVQMHGTNKSFFVPDNVYIIGMMNTADRSIALIDYALRRRFAFCTLEPAFENESFQEYVESKNSVKLEAVIELVSKLNDEIARDPLLGAGYKIGHSYFCTDEPIDSKLLRDIILYEIKPLLSEYWIDDADKVQYWTIKLLEAV
jgi:5-methylcytosine-specific restriction protein B